MSVFCFSVRVRRIELRYALWKSAILPLNYTRLRRAVARLERRRTSLNFFSKINHTKF